MALLFVTVAAGKSKKHTVFIMGSAIAKSVTGGALSIVYVRNAEEQQCFPMRKEQLAGPVNAKGLVSGVEKKTTGSDV